MKEFRLAGRYAKALFNLAIEMNVLEKVHADAELIIDVCEKNKEFVLMLRSPVIKDVKKLAIIKDIFEKNLNELTYRFVVLITRNKREGIIKEISERFIDQYREFKNILPVDLTTAIKLDGKIKGEILGLLKERSGSNIELTENVDEELIGGFMLSFDDKQYDASLQRQIKNLKKEFDINLYSKGF